jgi:indole-3-glycerol phosphate synthase
MNILSKIIENKRIEVDERKALYPIKLLEKSIYFNTQPVSLKKYILYPDKSGIIAEFKTKSPSKGDINTYAKVEKVSIDYMQAGASALSILTDIKYFGGSFNNLTKARKYNYCPILQKDFVIDEYQILEAKSIGADAILLIAAVLSKTHLRNLSKLAKSIGLEVLVEVHEKSEINKLNEFIDIVGVNNRNLKSFDTNIENSLRLSEQIPLEILKISESGIKSVDEIMLLKKAGFRGFLIGENFMSSPNPGKACKDFIQQIRNKEQELKTMKIIKHETESLRIE